MTVFLRKESSIGTSTASGVSLGQDSYVFAGVFQFFFVRLAIFFGCLGIFMNLFRGEMLDKSLHFYLLTPVRREVLLIGKYLAGLLAATVIFSVSTALQLIGLLFRFDSNAISQYLYQNHGISQIAAYLGVTVLACIGYGSIFLAAGLLFRNPIVPAAAVLVWEAANPVLPALLKKFSVIYYLKSLCPVQSLSIPECRLCSRCSFQTRSPYPLRRGVWTVGALSSGSGGLGEARAPSGNQLHNGVRTHEKTMTSSHGEPRKHARPELSKSESVTSA